MKHWLLSDSQRESKGTRGRDVISGIPLLPWSSEAQVIIQCYPLTGRSPFKACFIILLPDCIILGYLKWDVPRVSKMFCSGDTGETSALLPQSDSQFSCIRLFATPWTAERQASLSITNSRSLLKLISFMSVIPSNHLILCHPLLLLPSIFPSVRVSSNESVLRIRWPKYWSFSFNISPSNEYSGLISFRMDWLDLLAGQRTLKSLLQHHSSKASILQHWAFFIVQLSHSYMTTEKS